METGAATTDSAVPIANAKLAFAMKNRFWVFADIKHFSFILGVSLVESI
jgi:hypothetical protein